ncbi:MarR family winged helix-turn-helix transcriptional regulator [Desulfotignum balticum]|jgi:DNA-binding MarR family transcriptional regulator|uniref:MarR family winged helix-turn-helix transcriptional regulator n=1 Tax=Desulfotignum balticum TaxID=115781 RepID=UPI00041C926D|nr:MarR family winged helix-turn-helix transcriptional regulator [Desulfotignum balticum]
MTTLADGKKNKNIYAQSPCICGNLRRAGRLATKVYDACFQPIGIKVTQYTLLLAIQRLGTVTVTKLAEEVILERTTCTRNLNILEGKSLICFQQGPDKRMKLIALTKEGVDKTNAAKPLWQEAQKVMFDTIGEENALALLDELTRIIALLRQQ